MDVKAIVGIEETSAELSECAVSELSTRSTVSVYSKWKLDKLAKRYFLIT